MDGTSAELLRTAVYASTDAKFRLRVVQQQCQKLQFVMDHLQGQEQSRGAAQSAKQAETDAMQQSIQDAIRRARLIRAELAADNDQKDENDDEEQDTQPHAEDRQLQSILEVAKATRVATRQETKTDTTPQTLRVEYPRKLKALETQLQELRRREKHASMRFAFCCKMSEHMSTSVKRRELAMQKASGRMDGPVIQVSFLSQETRLCHAYQRLMTFMEEKMELQSQEFRDMASALTFSSVFPVYHRLKQAKKMLSLLNGEARAFMERTPPPPPKLSPAAKAHRDAVLARIRRKKPHVPVGVVDNAEVLRVAQQTQSPLDMNAALWGKFQAAWIERSSNDEASSDVYATTVREIVMTELSNAVLWSFKTHFAENSEPPDAAQVEVVMRLIRLVDSVALSRGRTYRSVVAS